MDCENAYLRMDKNMSSKVLKALDISIDRIGRGDSIEQCLSAYPEIQDELGELLQVFTLISTSPKVVPSESFRRQSKAQVMAGGVTVEQSAFGYSGLRSPGR